MTFGYGPVARWELLEKKNNWKAFITNLPYCPAYEVFFSKSLLLKNVDCVANKLISFSIFNNIFRSFSMNFWSVFALTGVAVGSGKTNDNKMSNRKQGEEESTVMRTVKYRKAMTEQTSGKSCHICMKGARAEKYFRQLCMCVFTGMQWFQPFDNVAPLMVANFNSTIKDVFPVQSLFL
jgi:hypothetical protein